MAVVANTFQSTSAVGNRETLSDVVSRITPEDTPIYSLIEKETFKGTHPEWETDDLAAPAANIRLEGDEYTFGATTPAVRVGNYTQIMRKDGIISGTQDATDNAGNVEQVRFQKVKKAVELRKDVDLKDLELMGMLGSGTFGRVRLVRHKREPTTPYALKQLQKARVVEYGQVDNVKNERDVMVNLNHPFILKCVATFQDKHSLFMLLEFVQGGELFSLLSKQDTGAVPVAWAKFFAACVSAALADGFHARKIAYRDLKPENLLLDSQGYIKVVDLGFAKHIPTRTYTLCGTPEYLAPEIVLGKGHDEGVDWWAVGILIFEMLCGVSPFADESGDQIKIARKIVRGKVSWPDWIRDAQAKDIVKGLLTAKQTKRLGCLKGGGQDVKAHAWFGTIDWAKLLRRDIKAPWTPKVKDPFDGAMFEPEDDDDSVVPYRGDQALFADF
jgi:serine/threonine protein kinase